MNVLLARMGDLSTWGVRIILPRSLVVYSAAMVEPTCHPSGSPRLPPWLVYRSRVGHLGKTRLALAWFRLLAQSTPISALFGGDDSAPRRGCYWMMAVLQMGN